MGGVLAALLRSRRGLPARAETLEERVERMERELNELKAELKRRDADASAQARRPAVRAADAGQRAAAAQPQTATAPRPHRPSGGKPAPVVTAQTRPERAETPMPTTKVPFMDRVRMGGYGSMRFEVTDNPADKEHLRAAALRAHRRRAASRRG